MKLDPVDRSLYRRHVAARDLVSFAVTVRETDLQVHAVRDLHDLVRDVVISERCALERHIAADPGFREALAPLPAGPSDAPIVRRMKEAAAAAGVGPMAAVAGAICDAVGSALAAVSPELIVENGGDLLVRSARERTVGIYTGEATLDLRLGLRLRPGATPLGICTSSGRIGHSLSFGTSSSATVLAPTAALGDAAATAVGNRVRGPDGLRRGLEAAQSIPGVVGAVIVAEGRLAAWGAVELVGLA